jgi:hypothetical protein
MMRPTETPLAAASVIACLPAFPHCRVARADRLAGLTSAVAATGDIRAGVEVTLAVGLLGADQRHVGALL